MMAEAGTQSRQVHSFLKSEAGFRLAIAVATPVALSTSSWYGPEGGGSGQARPNFSVTGFTQGPDANQSAITSALQEIAAALPNYSSCNNWLQGGGENKGTSGLQEIQNLLNPQSLFGFGHGTINLGIKPPYTVAYWVSAFSGATNSDNSAVPGLPASGGIEMTVNDVGAFFNATYNNNGKTVPLPEGEPQYQGNSPQARATILIHEVAHQITQSDFQPDGNDPTGEIHKANNHFVNANCNALIQAQH